MRRTSDLLNIFAPITQEVQTQGQSVGLMNTTTWDLNGTRAQVLTSFKSSHAHFNYWLFCRSPFRVRIGSRILYTTPTSGTFYYAVRYNGRYVVFVIIARIFWLVGFYNEHGIFQMIWEQKRLYMDDADTVLTDFDGNHARISGSSVEDTLLTTKSVRKGLLSISDYRGPTQRPQPEGLRSGIGRFVTLIMESKYGDIFNRCCGSIGGDFSKLGGKGASNHQVHNWSSKSGQALSRVDQGHETAEDMEDTREILDELSVFQLDAYNGGFFMHEPLPPLPREDTWEPIDDGDGDQLVGRPQARRGRFGAPNTAHRNAYRKNTEGVQKRAGLRGGRAGGVAEAPNWFVKWLQRDGEGEGEGEGEEEKEKDEKACNLVVKKARAMGLEVTETELFLKKELLRDRTTETNAKDSEEDQNQSKGLLVPGSCTDDRTTETNAKDSEEDKKQSKGLPGSCTDEKAEHALKDLRGLCFADDNESKEKIENPPINSGSRTCTPKSPLEIDIKELRDQGYVSDRNINRFFSHLSDSFGGDEGLIVFADAASTHLLAHGGPAAAFLFDLTSPQFTLFAVNDGDINVYEQEEGNHWSLLIFDNRDDCPRCFHHDSLGGANSSAAQHLTDQIRKLVPNTRKDVIELNTPRQETNLDCAIFVIAMARSIARWWGSGAAGGWTARIHREVSSRSVAALRLQLVDVLLGNVSFADLE